MGRGGRPPIQPPNLSKKSLPKPRLVPGRPSSVVGTGHSSPSNQLPSCQTTVNTKIPVKTETEVISKIPGIKKKSHHATSEEPTQDQKSEFELAPLFGTAGPSSTRNNIHTLHALASNNVIPGIKRPGSTMEQKRQCPSPKRPKAVGTAGPSSTRKNIHTLHALASNNVIPGIKRPGSTMEQKRQCPSPKRPKAVAQHHRKIKELEEKVAELELENAALRQSVPNWP
ncbi:uncharacterized protein LOC116976653 isoform X2 [Amblyraja radiata]|uniref:uncharacterized protein LOC116976653 isoform X2 n=1 Tax=Amblyraja radiata TaxID=386614 RepID=UPI00140419F5|nr:uncharacterized protein LOC116976653 isoform X2 [Amblyraja radiata]